MSLLQNVEMIKTLKINSGGKMLLAICWSGSSHLHQPRQKFNFKSYCNPIYWCTLWRHSYQYSVRKLTVSYSDTFKRPVNVPRYTSSRARVWHFTMTATDHINFMFRKSAYSFMSRVTSSPNSITTAIVNSNAYHQSALMDKWECMLYA